MSSFLIPFALGIFISILGRNNMHGNISSIHWYHRRRVTEENIKPFGRLMGLGTLIIGIALIIFSMLTFLTEQLHSDIFVLIGSVILTLSLIVGLGISFFAMFKYNKGIF